RPGRALGRAQAGEPRRRVPQPHRAQPARGGRMSTRTDLSSPASRTTPGTDAFLRTGVAKFLADTWAVFTREILLVLRDPFTLIFSLLQPLIFLGLFGPLLTGAVGGFGGGAPGGGG